MPIEPLGPVVVGVDGSAESSAALDLAAEEAAGRVTPLIVVHAYPRRHASAVVAACAPEWVDAVAARRRLLSVAAGRVAAEHPCLAVEGELVAGDPAEALIARSAQACLVVVGHRGGAALDGVPIGWVAMRVAARAAAPVVVHRPLDRHTGVESPRPVLVGVDVLGGTDSPVEFAFAEAALRGAPLVAMSVWSHPSGSYEQARGNAERMLSDAVRNWSEKYPEVPVRQVARYSLDTIRSLREVSATAQLVVVGRSRHTGLARLLLGSVSHGLVQSAGCPVAIVP